MHFPDLLETLLKERGILAEEREFFLNPDYSHLFDPLLLPDMEKARDRVIKAMKEGESITVFSDYDADGIPGAVVLADFFRRASYENVSFYIPHRHDEGFGLNKEFIEECKAKLLITVDCGMADIAEIKLAKEKGIDVIVTDHHESKELPEAFAIINPKRAGSKYPFKELCGSALAFKLVQAILAKNSFGVKEGMEKWSLDMVGIATLSDMVPLVGENRILACFGLDVLRKTSRPGLLALFNNLNLDRKRLSEDDITFMITPRINAASRMGVPEDAFNLLATNDEVEAKVLADHLEKINHERKGVVASMVKEAKKLLEAREALNSVIVIGNPEWKPSLAGLICNSLVEEYERPVFAWGRDGDGVIKGSCRSYNGYDLFELMGKAGGVFIEFGGHAGAGGFSVTLENLPTLEEKLSEVLPTSPSPLLGKERVLPMSLSDINEELWQTVSLFSPFGTGNEKPVFRIANAPVKNIRQFGKASEHLELTLGSGIKAISFFSSPKSYFLNPKSTHCTLYGTLEKSYFRSTPELRLRIVNIESTPNALK
ncbi:MAG: single-stranded-DNA-specific exonuclease RecJ [Candidatus Zambryskibacteria bacterium RIFCSPHIGHO2_01_FULL_49_18]|uniref:Single-stranded-DNA-specific exonuclease RecJ n=2 Tax=Candidatus Zambryskiibacteriota TaxID=1817925 RepID=A0A1G2T2X2_9BACT|nr:MAG: single-stranded-DNA-specific exonuclease RecJ [Candidatus Zambryskibacteria bacterium RIFCSPHIGHO2_01_FULL_49_18]OHB05750.1 MAG: single-stranded-DNA-specific exonuclease RecJ [Candidatus Zambryskibacteria bacterium RIFCSPLOWO2_01_FULL_47_14]